MNNRISPRRMDQLMASAMKNNLADIRQLLAKNGVSGAENFADRDAQIAFLKAVKDSASFRRDVSDYFSSMVMAKSNFVNQPQLDFVNQPQLDFIQQPMALNLFGAGDVGTGSAATGAAATSSTTTAPKTSFWDTLGGVANKDNLNNLFNTGLTVASNSLQNSANKESEERALELERIRLQQIQAANEAEASGAGGLSTGAWIGIGLGVVVLGTIIYFVAKKK